MIVFQEKFNENSDFLGRLEKEINPLLISNEGNLCEEEGLKALAHLLQKIVDEKLTIPKVTQKWRHEIWDILTPSFLLVTISWEVITTNGRQICFGFQSMFFYSGFLALFTPGDCQGLPSSRQEAHGPGNNFSEDFFVEIQKQVTVQW